MTGPPAVRDLAGTDPRDLAAAADLLAASVPDAAAGLVPYSLATYPRYLSAMLAPPPPLRTVVVRALTHGGTVVAVADWRLPGARLFLNGLAVAPAHRRQGLGRLLLADGAALAHRLGLPRLELDVDAGNSAALDLYRREGFGGSAVSAWRHVAVADNGDGRLVDWPAFAATRAAYGFADLGVRLGDGAVATVRAVGDALRVGGADGGRLPLAALCSATGCTRVFAVGAPLPGPAFVRFVRLIRSYHQ